MLHITEGLGATKGQTHSRNNKHRKKDQISQNTEIKSAQKVKSLQRKISTRNHYDAHAEGRKNWKSKSSYFHNADLKCMKFFILEDKRILDLGCDIGDLLELSKNSVIRGQIL